MYGAGLNVRNARSVNNMASQRPSRGVAVAVGGGCIACAGHAGPAVSAVLAERANPRAVAGSGDGRRHAWQVWRRRGQHLRGRWERLHRRENGVRAVTVCARDGFVRFTEERVS